MRSPTTSAKVEQFMRRLGESARGPGHVYFTGGACAVLLGWRDTTIDIDLKLAPEPAGVFEAIAVLKRELDINIELAAPDDFLPPLPGWQSRSRFIARHAEVDFFHYDFYAQALAKIERSHAQDLKDIRAMLDQGLVEPVDLLEALAEIEPQLIRYPAVDPVSLRYKLEEALARHQDD